MEKNSVIKIGKEEIKLTHLDKVIFPKDGITKEEVVSYYSAIAPVMLIYSKKHLISMLRYPDGIGHEGFYQKNASDYFPKWITRKPVQSADGDVVNYVVFDKKSTLIYLANQLCLIPHIWLSRVDKLNYPDRMIFDLDPSGKKFDFNLVRKTALVLKELLEEIGLVPYVMTTGSRGLHVVVPLDRKQPFEFVRSFAKEIVYYVQSLDQKNLTLEMRKDKRGKKIFLDWLRNSFTATAVAPYAIRAKEGAPVATPIDWKEVDDSKLVSTRYTIHTVFKRLEKKGDPWEGFYKNARSLVFAHKRFNTRYFLR